VLTSDQKGASPRLRSHLRPAKLGITVLKPVNEGVRYDLVLDLSGSLMRIQCKWAALRGDVIVVSCQSGRRTRDGFMRRPYTKREVDAIAAFCPDLDRCYYLPPEVFAGHPAVQLRVAPTLNNQKLRINWAEDYDFEARLKSLGAVAQLGERLHGMQEVTGSSPVGST
jgi:hypothetical protein